jgi:hypothetical protein
VKLECVQGGSSTSIFWRRRCVSRRRPPPLVGVFLKVSTIRAAANPFRDDVGRDRLAGRGGVCVRLDWSVGLGVRLRPPRPGISRLRGKTPPRSRGPARGAGLILVGLAKRFDGCFTPPPAPDALPHGRSTSAGTRRWVSTRVGLGGRRLRRWLRSGIELIGRFGALSQRLPASALGPARRWWRGTRCDRFRAPLPFDVPHPQAAITAKTNVQLFAGGAPVGTPYLPGPYRKPIS